MKKILKSKVVFWIFFILIIQVFLILLASNWSLRVLGLIYCIGVPFIRKIKTPKKIISFLKLLDSISVVLSASPIILWALSSIIFTKVLLVLDFNILNLFITLVATFVLYITMPLFVIPSLMILVKNNSYDSND